MLTPINNMMSNIEGVGWDKGLKKERKKQLLRKIFTLTVDSPCSSPLVATHLYVPSFSFPALYSVRTDDDSSLRVTVMSGLFGSILSPLGPNHSIFLATPTTERTSKNSVSKTRRLIRSAFSRSTTGPLSFACLQETDGGGLAASCDR